MIDTLCLATHNQGKIAELRAMLTPYSITLTSAADFNIPPPDETGTTFTENAMIKARAVMNVTNLPTLADDSGICVDALDGAPGVYAADWMGPNRDASIAMARVLSELTGKNNRKAYFTSTLALITPDGEEHIFEGRVYGTIAPEPRGTNGHGYDPIMIPDGHTRTFGEMSDTEKASLSHRANAMAKFLDVLKT